MNTMDIRGKTFGQQRDALTTMGDRGPALVEVVIESSASRCDSFEPRGDELTDDEAEAFFFV